MKSKTDLNSSFILHPSPFQYVFRKMIPRATHHAI